MLTIKHQTITQSHNAKDRDDEGTWIWQTKNVGNHPFAPLLGLRPYSVGRKFSNRMLQRHNLLFHDNADNASFTIRMVPALKGECFGLQSIRILGGTGTTIIFTYQRKTNIAIVLVCCIAIL